VAVGIGRQVGQGGTEATVALAHPVVVNGTAMESLKERFLQLFRKLADDFVSGRASVGEVTFADRDHVELRPSNPRAAPILVIVPKDEAPVVTLVTRKRSIFKIPRDGVTLVIGKGTIFEIPKEGGRYTEHHSVVEEAGAICRAVLTGRFEERVKIKGDDVVSSKGTVDLPPPVTARWGQLFYNPFRRTSVHHLHYEAY